MNKTMIVSSVLAILAVPAMASTELYKDDKHSAAIGGYLAPLIINTQNVTELVNAGSRINFHFTRSLRDDWGAYAHAEWGFNPFGSTDLVYNNKFETVQNEFLYNRLGYVGLSHEGYGSLTIGKQWGAWYDVVYGTNYSFVWDGNAAGVYTYNKDDGAVNGVGRGDNLIQYRNNYYGVDLVLQAQIKHRTFFTCDVPLSQEDCEALWQTGSFEAQQVQYDYTYGGALTGEIIDNLKIAVGFNRGAFDVTFGTGLNIKAIDRIYGVGLTWGDFDAEGLYASANYNHNEFHDTDNIGRLIRKAFGVESLLSYKFSSHFRAMVSYNLFKAAHDYVVVPDFNADPNDVFKRQFWVMGIHYLWNDSLILFLEGRLDSSDFTSVDKAQEEAMSLSEDDGVAFGIRYSF